MALSSELRVLVIDDQIAIPGPDRESFLEAVGDHVAFSYCSGLDDGGHPSIDVVTRAVLSGWPFADGARWALVLLDVRFGTMSEFGFEVLRYLRDDSRFGMDLPVVMLTSEDAAKKSRAGQMQADGFLPKLDVLGRPLLSSEALHDRLMRCALMPDDRAEPSRLIGSSLAFMKTLRQARRAAMFGEERLLFGETGVGKTSLAAYMHHHSGRLGRFAHTYAEPLNPQQTRIQLFGVWKGAYTGQLDRSMPGRIEEAHGGTFFLDEVSNLSSDLQAGLLKFREKDPAGRRRIRRDGLFPQGTRHEAEARNSVVPPPQHIMPDGEISVDVLFFSGTNVDLEDAGMREERGFREDLFYALGTRLYCPCLNERRDDIRDVFRAVLMRRLEPLRSRSSLDQIEVDESVYQVLESRDWSARGNMRDVDRIAAHTAGALVDFDRLYVHDLPEDVLAPRVSVGVASSTIAVASTAGTGSPPAGSGRAWALAEVNRLRHQAELLEQAAEETRDRDYSTGQAGHYQPSVAVQRLTGGKIPSTSAKRLIKEMLGRILEPTQAWEELLEAAGLPDVQAWVRTRPLLVALYAYSCSEISAETIAARVNSTNARGAGR